MSKIIHKVIFIVGGVFSYIFGGLGTILIFAVFGPASKLGPVGNTPVSLVGPVLRLVIGYSFFSKSIYKTAAKAIAKEAKDSKNSVLLEELKDIVKKTMIVLFVFDLLFVISLILFSSYQ